MNGSPYERLPQELFQPRASWADGNGAHKAAVFDSFSREIADMLPAMVWISDPDGHITIFNKRWLQFAGQTHESALREWTAALHPDDALAHLGLRQQAFQSYEPFASEYRLRRADGVYRWILDQGAPRFGAHGEFQGYVGLAIDITERKGAEEQLRWLSTAVEQSPASVVITDLQGAIEYVNPKFTEVTGYTREEALGQNPRILKSGELPAETYRELWDTIQTREWRGEFHNRKKSGELYWESASISPIRDENGKPNHYIAVKEDITIRKEMEAALRASAARLRVAMQIAEICMYDLDVRTGKCEVEGGDEFLKSLGGFDGWLKAIHADDRDRVMAAMRSRRESQEVLEIEYRMVRPDGTVGHYLDRGAPEREGHWIGATRDVTSRKQANETQARLAAIVECSRDAILSLDAGGAVRSWNLAAEKLYGYTAAEIFGRPANQLATSGRRDGAARNIARAVSGTPLPPFETEHVSKGGVIFPVSITASPILDHAGKAIGASVIIRDITGQKRAQQALLESESRFRALVQNSSDVITLIDPGGKILYDSPGVSDFLGVSPEERLGCEAMQWIHADDLSYMRMLHAELLQTSGAKLRAQLRLRHADGSFRWCDSWAVNLLDDPGVGALVTSFRDITELKGVETALRESEQRYRLLVEDASDTIFTIDLEGNLTSVNTMAERISGYSRQELLCMNLEQITAPECLEAVRQRIQARMRGAETPALESELVTRDGRRVPMEVSGRLQFKNGTATGLLCIARDISQRKRFEQLEHDRGEVLEMVAQNRPLDEVLLRLEELIDQYYPGTRSRVVVAEDRNHAKRSSQPEIPSGYPNRVEAPIRGGTGQVMGSLEIYSPRPWEPNESERRVLEFKARLAAIALEHRQLTNRMAHQAHHDPLTGLPNRLLLDDHLHHAMSLARRQSKMVALIYVDLDRFKFINDTLGHHVGDLLLKEVALRMRSAVRESDTLARTGGDEFVAVLFGIERVCDAEVVADRIVDALRAPFHMRGHELFTSASVGLSLFPQDGEDAGTLHRHADLALYEAKNRGRNRFQIFAPAMNASSEERLTMESHLHRALARGELYLHFQPQFDIATGKLDGVEALLRWDHPKWGFVSPQRFIPVAEETGLIIPIGLWVLRQACRQHMMWRRAGHPPVRMAVNISATQFMRSNLAETAAEVLAAHEMEARYLELELTEGVLMRDTEDSARQIADLRQLGVRISIDDFGTGFSSLSYLQRLPIDDLKIDKCFVAGMDHRTGARPLVQAIVGLAHGLRMTATAEGVERQEELEALRALGCDRVQGFLLGRPAPADGCHFWPAADPVPDGCAT
ncbi:MAG: PAS domain S-box protein [Bryobacteraceae bacterium]|jgi:diguanylate cyclase (GGDEF)-like protein/PAS domain S-box-containing protein